MKWGFYWGEYKNNNVNKKCLEYLETIWDELSWGTCNETMSMNVLWPLSREQ